MKKRGKILQDMPTEFFQLLNCCPSLRLSIFRFLFAHFFERILQKRCVWGKNFQNLKTIFERVLTPLGNVESFELIYSNSVDLKAELRIAQRLFFLPNFAFTQPSLCLHFRLCFAWILFFWAGISPTSSSWHKIRSGLKVGLYYDWSDSKEAKKGFSKV